MNDNKFIPDPDFESHGNVKKIKIEYDVILSKYFESGTIVMLLKYIDPRSNSRVDLSFNRNGNYKAEELPKTNIWKMIEYPSGRSTVSRKLNQKDYFIIFSEMRKLGIFPLTQSNHEPVGEYARSSANVDSIHDDVRLTNHNNTSRINRQNNGNSTIKH